MRFIELKYMGITRKGKRKKIHIVKFSVKSEKGRKEGDCSGCVPGQRKGERYC